MGRTLFFLLQPGESSELDKEIEELVTKLQHNLEKEMQQLQFGIDIYEDVKIEAPNLHLPDALVEPNTDPTSGDIYYKHIFGNISIFLRYCIHYYGFLCLSVTFFVSIFAVDDNLKSQHLAEAVSPAAQADRKVYRIRDKEVCDIKKFICFSKYGTIVLLMICNTRSLSKLLGKILKKSSTFQDSQNPQLGY